jgi:hypothetical protein
MRTPNHSDRVPALSSSSDMTPRVDDLALFFTNDSGHADAVWITREDYTQEKNRIAPLPSEWKNGVFLESTSSKAAVYYVLNLARLLPPGIAPKPKGTEAGTAPATRSGSGTPAASPQPGDKDLVVIPSDEPDAAYVVPRSLYQGCLPLDRNSPQASDLVFMVFNQGILLANLPKPTNNNGWTCNLLSLLSLRSAAQNGAKSAADIRTTHYDSFVRQAQSLVG